MRLGQCQTSKTFTSPSTNLNLGGGRVEIVLFVGSALEIIVIGSWAMIITENQHKIANFMILTVDFDIVERVCIF